MAKPRRRSRFLTVLLCLCLLANLVPVQAMAAGAGADRVSSLRQIPGCIERERCRGVILRVKELAQKENITFHVFIISLTCFL